MSDYIIKVENLSKSYLINHQNERYTALRDVLTNSIKHAGRRLLGRTNGAGPSQETFWALKDVSFEVKPGERVGIIGRNGAGKSTLLKILSRITEPTQGRVRIRGRVASLLEVGTGFHPELTGRENIYLNGAILGMSRTEIRRKFDEIVAFAEVEQFLDTPVKRYSSGMYVRLAFAVAVHLEPDILLVDEVLAVGDAEFQKKCIRKMEEVSQGGRTILFISHNMAAVRHLCHRGLVLEHGLLIEEGQIDEVVDKYLARISEQQKVQSIIETRSFIVDNVQIYSVKGPVIKTFDPVEIKVRFTAKIDILEPGLYVGILSFDNQRITGLDFRDFCSVPPLQANEQCELGFVIDNLPLLSGTYQIELHLKDMANHKIEFLPQTYYFDIVETPIYGGRKTDGWYGLVGLKARVSANVISSNEKTFSPKQLTADVI